MMGVMRTAICGLLVWLMAGANAQANGETTFLCGETFITFQEGWIKDSEPPVKQLITVRKKHVLFLQKWMPGRSATVAIDYGGKLEMKIIALPEPIAHLLWARIVECLD